MAVSCYCGLTIVYFQQEANDLNLSSEYPECRTMYMAENFTLKHTLLLHYVIAA